MLHAEPAESKRSRTSADGADCADWREHRGRAAHHPVAHRSATISTMVIYAEKTRHVWEMGVAALRG